MWVQPRYYRHVILMLALGAGLCSRSLPKLLPAQQIAKQNTERIVDQVEPLCRLIAPDQGTLHFMAYPTTMYRKDSSRRHFWMVDCLDVKGKIIIHLVWNEDARRVVQISRLDRPVIHPRMLPLSNAQAIETARKWTLILHLAQSVEVWNSAYKVFKTDNILRVRLYLREGSIVVWIRAETGEIFGTFAHDTLGYSSPPAITVDEPVPPAPQG